MQIGAPRHIAEKVFYGVLLVYLVVGLINLDVIPIPWLDEAACLEPAVLWKRTGSYISKAWPTPGTEDIFLSYPPGIMMLHRLTLGIFPCEVFWVRLPFLLLHVGAIWLLFRVFIRNQQIDSRWAALLCLYFLFDKAVFEISRSVRGEVIEVALLVAWMAVYTRVKPMRKGLQTLILGLLCGAMLLTHLKLWPVVAVLSVWYVWQEFTVPKLIGYAAGLLVLPLCFLIFIDFRIAELYAQLFQHSMEHTAGGGLHIRIYNYFIGRFYPVYKEQPWLPLLHGWVTWLAWKQFRLQPKNALPAAVWLIAGLVWLLFLGPYYRYFLPMYVVGLWVVASHIADKCPAFPNLKKWYWWPVIGMMLFPFVSRHALGIIQRPERDPKSCVAFLETQMPVSGRVLLYGNEIGLYYAAKHSNVDFTHVTSPDHFGFGEYDSIYYLTDVLHPELVLKATYKPQQLALPGWMYALGRGGTFANMHIYVIGSEAEWKSVATPFYGWD
ncbi:MAG: hypothetical protein EBV15_06315 [Bacteroidetes bacterium]|nr:hypothetical protein [Bacteroidota bacterium]